MSEHVKKDVLRLAYMAGWMDRSMKGSSKPFSTEKKQCELEFESWFERATFTSLSEQVTEEKTGG